MEDAELLTSVATCLGRRVDQDDGSTIYIKDDLCLAGLKDLQRFMRRDNPETRDVFMTLGQWNIVRSDLVPLIASFFFDRSLLLNAVKLVVFLTMPPDKGSLNLTKQYEYLRAFKAAILEGNILPAVVSLLEEPLSSLERGEATEEEWKMAQLILTLLRNLLSIPDADPQVSSAASLSYMRSLQDDLLSQLDETGIMDVILALTSLFSAPAVGGGDQGRLSCAAPFFLQRDNVLLLELFLGLFCWTKPEDILHAHRPASKEQIQQDSKQLLGTIMAEQKARKEAMMKKGTFRHSRFSGTFTARNMDNTGRIVSSNPFNSPLDQIMKNQVRSGRVRRVAAEESRETHKASTAARYQLKMWAEKFLESCYYGLMLSIKKDMIRDRPGITPIDTGNFFRLSYFFTAFQRQALEANGNSKGTPAEDAPSPPSSSPTSSLSESLSATMDEGMFRLVVSRWSEFADGHKAERQWGNLAAGGELLKEMIHLLDIVLKRSKQVIEQSKEPQQRNASGAPGHQEDVTGPTSLVVGPTESEVAAASTAARVSRVLLLKLFYDDTPRGVLYMLQRLMKDYDRTWQPRSHLENLVEASHLVLRLLEDLQKSEGVLRVLKKKRQKKTRGTEATGEEAEGGRNGEGRGGTAGAGEDPGQNGGGETGRRPVETAARDANGAIGADGEPGMPEGQAGDGPQEGSAALEGPAGDRQHMEGGEGHEAAGNGTGGEKAEAGAAEQENGIPEEKPEGPGELPAPEGDREVEPQAAEVRWEGEGATAGAGEEELNEEEEWAAGFVEEEVEGEDEMREGEDGEGEGGEGEAGGSQDDDPQDEMELAAERAEANFEERPLNMHRAVTEFADVATVRNCCWLLQSAEKNNARTNYFVTRLLEWIVEECSVEPMLFQLSILHSFYLILSSEKLKRDPDQQQLLSFVRRTVRHLSAQMRKEPSATLVHLLFWTGRREAMSMAADVMMDKLKGAGRRGRGRGWGTDPGGEGRGGGETATGDEGQAGGGGNHWDDFWGDGGMGEPEEQCGSGRRKAARRRGFVMGSDEEDGGINLHGDGEEDDGWLVDELEDMNEEGGVRMSKNLFRQRQRQRQQQEGGKRKGASGVPAEYASRLEELFEKHKAKRSVAKLVAEELDPSGETVTKRQVAKWLKQLGLKREVKKRRGQQAQQQDAEGSGSAGEGEEETGSGRGERGLVEAVEESEDEYFDDSARERNREARDQAGGDTASKIEALLREEDGPELFRWLKARLKGALDLWQEAGARTSWLTAGEDEEEWGARPGGAPVDEDREAVESDLVHMDLSLVEDMEDWDRVDNKWMEDLLLAFNLRTPAEGSGCWKIPGDRGTEWLREALAELERVREEMEKRKAQGAGVLGLMDVEEGGTALVAMAGVSEGEGALASREGNEADCEELPDSATHEETNEEGLEDEVEAGVRHEPIDEVASEEAHRTNARDSTTDQIQEQRGSPDNLWTGLALTPVELVSVSEGRKSRGEERGVGSRGASPGQESTGTARAMLAAGNREEPALCSGMRDPGAGSLEDEETVEKPGNAAKRRKVLIDDEDDD